MFGASIQLIISVLAISILHAILPNHWLPVVAISNNLKWSAGKTAMVTMLAALAHSASTVIIGLFVAYGGMHLDNWLPYFKFISAGILIVLGVLFIWRHQHHMHFHLKDVPTEPYKGMVFILGSLLTAMFLSPCLEVGALFLVAGTTSMSASVFIAIVYTLTSAVGMTVFAWLAMQGLKKVDWHKLEHSSGLISGIILIITGALFLFLD